MACKVLRGKQLVLVLAAMALAACSQSDDVVASSEPAAECGPEVTFCASMGPEARAESVDNSSFGDHPGWGIGIYGYFTGQTDWSEYLGGKPDPDFMNDQYAGYDSGSWSYDPVKFWPNVNGGKLSFIAYYPKLASPESATSGIATSASTNSYGLPQIDVDITADGSNITTENMFDLLVSEPAVNLTKEGGKVTLNMRHAMSRLTICARHLADGADENMRVFIESVAIKATSESNLYKSATYSWTKVGGEAKGGWTNHSKCDDGTTISLENVLNTASPSLGTYNTPSVMLNTGGAPTPLLKSDEWLMFIPTGEDCLDAMAEITYSVVDLLTGVVSGQKTVDVPIDELQLKEGETHTLCFTIGADKISLKSLGEANCYMINSKKFESGIYIPLSQAKRGYDLAASASSSSSTLTLSTDGFSVEEAAVGGGTNPDVIDDGSCRIEQVGSEYYLYVKFQGTFTNTNTVLRLKQGDDVVWSWHLWLTDYVPNLASPSSTARGDVIPYTISSTTRYCMDRNLGAVCSVDHVVTSNDAPSGTATDYYGLYYQFGRKDPFAGVTQTASNATAMTLLDAVQNPGSFYMGCSYNWSSFAGEIWNNLNFKTESGTGKSVFDPCPPGWRIRPNGENIWNGDGFTTVNKSTDWHSNGYTLYFDSASGPFTWFPAAGFLLGYDGSYYYGGSYGNSWSASIYGENDGYSLYFDSFSLMPSDFNIRAFGFSVRCVQE